MKLVPITIRWRMPRKRQCSYFHLSDIAQAAEGADRVYFVVFAQAIEEYEELQGMHHPQLAWLVEHYHQTDVTVFNDLEVYRFEN